MTRLRRWGTRLLEPPESDADRFGGFSAQALGATIFLVASLSLMTGFLSLRTSLTGVLIGASQLANGTAFTFGRQHRGLVIGLRVGAILAGVGAFIVDSLDVAGLLWPGEAEARRPGKETTWTGIASRG